MFEVNKTVVGSLCFAALLTATAYGYVANNNDSTRAAVATKQSAQKSEPAQLQEGASAPDFTLPTDDGRQIKLSDYQGKQIVVLYFYPRDETPGCTKQACAFRDSLADYKKENIEVLGVSVDSVDSHKEFKKNQKLNFTLLADVDKKVSGQYGVLSAAGYSSRTTFVIGKDGLIKKIYQKVDPALNAAEVLAFARTIS